MENINNRYILDIIWDSINLDCIKPGLNNKIINEIDNNTFKCDDIYLHILVDGDNDIDLRVLFHDSIKKPVKALNLKYKTIIKAIVQRFTFKDTIDSISVVTFDGDNNHIEKSHHTYINFNKMSMTGNNIQYKGFLKGLLYLKYLDDNNETKNYHVNDILTELSTDKRYLPISEIISVRPIEHSTNGPAILTIIYNDNYNIKKRNYKYFINQKDITNDFEEWKKKENLNFELDEDGEFIDENTLIKFKLRFFS